VLPIPSAASGLRTIAHSASKEHLRGPGPVVTTLRHRTSFRVDGSGSRSSFARTMSPTSAVLLHLHNGCRRPATPRVTVQTPACSWRSCEMILLSGRGLSYDKPDCIGGGAGEGLRAPPWRHVVPIVQRELDPLLYSSWSDSSSRACRPTHAGGRAVRSTQLRLGPTWASCWFGIVVIVSW